MELELGSLLKKAREEKGLIIDDIQEETKIRKKYLEAIEENNFDILPGKVYLKVFVKGYAREVDLDYQELLKKYKVLNIKEEKESNLQKDYLNGTKFSSGSEKNNRKNPIKIIFIILLILFLGGAVVYTYQYINSAELRLLNQQSSQNQNIKEDSQLLEVEENNNSETAFKTEEENYDPEETAGDSSSDISDFDLSSSDNEENNNLLEFFDSGVLREENTEIIDQNNFSELEGLDSQEKNQISEIIITDDINNQQENELNNQQENLKNEIQDTEDQNDAVQSDLVEEGNNNQNENQVSEEAVNSTDNEELPADEAENQEEVVLDNKIEIAAADTVWITVDVDGANAFSGILEAGDRQQFEVDNRLYIKIGNGSAITAEIGGETYGPWAGDGGIAEVEFLNNGEDITINNLRN